MTHPWKRAASVLLVAQAAACLTGAPPPNTPVTAVQSQASTALEPFYEQRLAARQVDYFRAFRVASLKLRGTLPTLPEIRELQLSLTPVDTYTALIRRILDGVDATGTAITPHPAFNQVVDFWKNTLVLDAPPNPNVGVASLESPAIFAAMVTLSDSLPYTQLFTTSSATCWTMQGDVPTSSTCTCSANSDPAGGAVPCFDSNAPNAGIVGNPGFQAANHGNFAFHRIRMIQEIFACRPMPAEPFGTWDSRFPPPDGGALPSTPVEFSSDESVVCATCHQTMNRQAPLFGQYDRTGVLRDRANLKLGSRTCPAPPADCDLEVDVPISPVRAARLSDLLVFSPGQLPALGWRAVATGSSLSDVGAAMAQDPAVARCLLQRLWYWLFSRREVSVDPIRPPEAMVTAWVAGLTSAVDPFTGQARTPNTLRGVLMLMLTSDDFVRF